MPYVWEDGERVEITAEEAEQYRPAGMPVAITCTECDGDGCPDCDGTGTVAA